MAAIEKILKDKIKVFGSLSLQEFFTIALYDIEYGYYSKKKIIGSHGDFITSPEISQVFGEMIANWIMINVIKFYKHKSFNICELGPGKGTLIKDIMRTIYKVDKETFRKIENVYLYEKSPSFIDEINKKLSKVKIIDDLGNIQNKQTFFIANEFLDAIPMDQYEYYENNWYKRVVILDKKNRFKIVISSKPSITNRYFPKNPIDHSIFEFSSYMINILFVILNFLKKNGGIFLIIDYAKEIDEKFGTLSAINNHKKVHPLFSIGETDISYKPDYDLISKIAKSLGCIVYGPVTQSFFLQKLGINERFEQLIIKNSNYKNRLLTQKNRLLDINGMGNLFKILAISDTKHTNAYGFEK